MKSLVVAVRLLALLAVPLVAGCSTSSTAGGGATAAPSGLDGFYHQRLTWWHCERQFECTNLSVPLDYTHPGGRVIQLAVIRAAATDPAHRIGSLITNPGGPGESGVQFLRESYPSYRDQPSGFDDPLRADFDIVSFDPRGVGHSAPITCLSGRQLDRFNSLNTNPTTPDQIDALVTEDKKFTSGCQNRSGELLPFVGTPNAARDIDVLRGALGDAKLYYLGYSYGTYLGAYYAELFPGNVGRAVFDGPLPTDLSTRQSDLQQTRGFQVELNRFIADCVTHPDCPLGTDPNTAATKLADFFASAHAHPLPTDTDRTVDEALAQTGVVSALYQSPESWSELRDTLREAMSGHGDQLLGLADDYNQRHHGARYANGNEAGDAVNCLDHPVAVHSVADVQAELPAFRQASPLIGASDAWAGLLCAYWPVPAQSRPHQIHYAGSPPILVVGNTHDPATPYQGAQEMARQLGSAVLLTYDFDGHTGYGRGSTCIDTAVDRYLTSGTAPPAATTCRPDPQTPHQSR